MNLLLIIALIVCVALACVGFTAASMIREQRQKLRDAQPGASAFNLRGIVNALGQQTAPQPSPDREKNELDGYRPGGALRAEISQHPATAREALLGRIARWIASLVAELTLNRSGSLWTMLEQYGATVDDSLL